MISGFLLFQTPSLLKENAYKCSADENNRLLNGHKSASNSNLDTVKDHRHLSGQVDIPVLIVSLFQSPEKIDLFSILPLFQLTIYVYLTLLQFRVKKTRMESVPENCLYLKLLKQICL